MKMIGQRERFGSHLGLERIELICQVLGNPQEHLRFIHVAGTNGKGSVSALLAEVLKNSGFKTGLFTSPHLEHYRERFRINGEAIDLETLEAVTLRAEKACQEVEAAHPELGSVTEFELATAAGFVYFKQFAVDVVVLETGLGGRLDATNVVKPVLTIITTVGLDHQDRLGPSLEEIAREKGGIIKPRVPLISGVKSPAAQSVLQTIAMEKEAPWHSTKDVPWEGHGWSLDGGSLSFPGFGLIRVGLLGDHQLQNAATALLAVQELISLGWVIPLEAINQGMEGAKWPGRLEIISREPFILLDGSHNQDGIDALCRSLNQIQGELESEKFTVIFGMLHNKPLELIDPLLPLAERFIFTAAESGRLAPMEPELLVDYVRKKGGLATNYANIADALAEAAKTPPLCICGSLYLVGAVKRYF